MSDDQLKQAQLASLKAPSDWPHREPVQDPLQTAEGLKQVSVWSATYIHKERSHHRGNLCWADQSDGRFLLHPQVQCLVLLGPVVRWSGIISAASVSAHHMTFIMFWWWCHKPLTSSTEEPCWATAAFWGQLSEQQLTEKLDLQLTETSGQTGRLCMILNGKKKQLNSHCPGVNTHLCHWFNQSGRGRKWQEGTGSGRV